MIPFTVFVCVLSQWETEVFKFCRMGIIMKQLLLKPVHVLAMFMLMLVLILVTSDCSGSAFVGCILVWICNEYYY